MYRRVRVCLCRPVQCMCSLVPRLHPAFQTHTEKRFSLVCLKTWVEPGYKASVHLYVCRSVSVCVCDNNGYGPMGVV